MNQALIDAAIKSVIFPDILASPHNMPIAQGGDLSPVMLINAYGNGVFPWFNPGEEIQWWSPDPRFILVPKDIVISRSMRQFIKKNDCQILLDQNFEQVIYQCSLPRANEPGTWISKDMIRAYCRLHEQGLAHSVEIYFESKLVGGLYGVSLGRAFFGESMFSLMPNTSKLALIFLAKLWQHLSFDFIDSQVYTQHLDSMGAKMLSRKFFLSWLKKSLQHKTMIGNWSKFNIDGLMLSF